MSDVVDKLKHKQSELKDIKEKLIRLEAERDMLSKRLREEFNVNDLESAKRLLEDFNSKLTETEAGMEKLLDKVEETVSRFNES